jgi:3-oxoacyl-[acyl-carrier protein] reductase
VFYHFSHSVRTPLVELTFKPDHAAGVGQRLRRRGRVTDNPTAIVTGAASGIGLATANLLAASGYEVILCDRVRADAAVASIKERGGRGEVLLLDLTDVAAVKRAMAALSERHTNVTAVVANAGISGHGIPFAQVDEAAFDAMMSVHVRGHFFMLQALVPNMPAGSSIVIVSSAFARVGHAAMPHYSAAKGALLSLTRALAAELGPTGIRVNAVTPGLVRTPLTEKSAQTNPGLFDDAVRHLPLRRLTTPEDVAATIAWLLSPAAAAMTGQALSPSSGGVMAD